MSHYRSFLVRLWKDSDISPLKISVVDPRTNEKRTFSEVSTFLDFWAHLCGDPPGEGDGVQKSNG